MTEYKLTGGLKLFVYYFFVGAVVILTNFTLTGEFFLVVFEKRKKNKQKSLRHFFKLNILFHGNLKLGYRLCN